MQYRFAVFKKGDAPLKKIIKKLLSFFPVKKLIVFESIPNLSDNTKAVFDEMIKRNMNNTYKMIWIVSGECAEMPNMKNVYYCNKSLKFYKYKLLYYRIFAKAFICCNEFITALRKGQTSFYLTHGTCIKSVYNYYNVPANVDYMIVDGKDTREVMAYELRFPVEKTVALGYPRNDILINTNRDIKPLFPGYNFEKVVVWYPTFRQHKNGSQNASSHALPILHDEEQALKLNELAKNNKALIVLKPHFAQDVSKIKACNLSNIVFIDDEFFVKNNITSYEFIGNSDALITDYSSVYYDYLLCDKPIGLVWEDYEEYKKSVSFAVDMERIMKAGEKIYNLADFGSFLENLSAGNDTLKNERAEISAWANYSKDGKSSQRAVDYIIEKAGL